jgi:ABC-type cobalamin/Fe3+-siderophores transport system ATPase subunit
MFTYKLPDHEGKALLHETENNSLIIIGANGSGKSKLGAWIEEKDMENTHRVGAQRSLNMGDFIQLKSYEQAENLLLYGKADIDLRKMMRWYNPNDSWKPEMTTKLLNDYDNVLSALVAMKNNQNDAFIKDCKEREAHGQQHKNTPETVIDKLKKIWKNVFPQRDVDFEDAKVVATLNRQGAQPISYKGREMSDGERVGLYLIAQCLCIPHEKTIIIDEPEIHLHRSIMNRLWIEIEKSRPDCFFIYITHDTQFAAQHRQAKKIWVKSFDGSNWDLEEIPESDLPEQLLLDILGNRKKVLFVEGTSGSYDTKLCSEIYDDYYVVPCGSCSTVISQAKAMRNTPQLHNLECYGIIDRDYRSDREIESLKEHGIYTLKVAEVENLFLVEEILSIVNNIEGFQGDTKIDAVKNYIINDRFSKEINQQIFESVAHEIKHRLMTTIISKTNEEEAKQALSSIPDNIFYDQIKHEQEERFMEILASKDYKKVLAVFNRKDLMKSIGHFFQKNNKDYGDFIIRHLQGDSARQIKDAIIPYLPNEIPREQGAGR